MKKILWLIAFIFNTVLFLNNAYCLGKLSNSVTINCSEKADSMLYDFNLDLDLIKVYSTFKDDACNFSTFFNFKNKELPWSVQFKTGNLSNYGVFSKLNSPVLSNTVSPFSTAETSCLSLKSSHADSAFSAPLSMFTQIEYSEKSKKIYRAGNQFLMIYADLNKEYEHLPVYAMNNYADFMFKQSSLSFSVYTGLFPYYHKKQTSWFNEPYYSDNYSLDSLFQTAFSNKNFSSVFSAFIYTNPIAQIETAFKSENSFSIKNMLFNLSGFIIPGNKIFTSASKNYESQIQLKTNFQAKQILPHLSTGSTTFCKIDLYDREHYLKNSTGIKILKNNFQLNCSINTKLVFSKTDSNQYEILFTDIDVISKLQFILNFCTITLNSNIYCDFTKNYKSCNTTEKINAQIDFNFMDNNEKLKFSADTTVELKQYPDKQNKAKINTEFKAEYLLNSFYSFSFKILISSL